LAEFLAAFGLFLGFLVMGATTPHQSGSKKHYLKSRSLQNSLITVQYHVLFGKLLLWRFHPKYLFPSWTYIERHWHCFTKRDKRI